FGHFFHGKLIELKTVIENFLTPIVDKL
ncbi:alpha/beta hydrolase, partial [Francisella tularensis subsp. holarctica]|nr:alpha/beta hydrolase [Francisella tularensis subsp. holarctica]